LPKQKHILQFNAWFSKRNIPEYHNTELGNYNTNFLSFAIAAVQQDQNIFNFKETKMLQKFLNWH
jgi:hypothetical protein